jgi:hypothetical protein
MQDALKGATPREMEYFNSVMMAMPDIIGLRFASGQNAAKWSVQSIQRELPLIGAMGINSQKDYVQRMMQLNSNVHSVINGAPGNGPALAWLNKRKSDLDQLQKNSTPTPKTPQQNAPTGGTTHFVEGGNSWDIPADKVAAFKQAHPNAQTK